MLEDWVFKLTETDGRTPPVKILTYTLAVSCVMYLPNGIPQADLENELLAPARYSIRRYFYREILDWLERNKVTSLVGDDARRELESLISQMKGQ